LGELGCTRTGNGILKGLVLAEERCDMLDLSERRIVNYFIIKGIGVGRGETRGEGGVVVGRDGRSHGGEAH
jgi:hypothetical protein